MKVITKYVVLLLVIVLGFAVTSSIHAQEQKDMLFVPTNVLDKLVSAQATNSYYLEVSEPQVISLQILTMSESYSPSFTVYNSAGETIPVIAGVMSGWGVDMRVTLPKAGTYRILVGALNSGYGDYLLRTTKIGSFEHHEYGLTLDSHIEATITGNQVLHRFNFTAQPSKTLTLYVSSDMSHPDIGLSLTNQSKSQEAGAMDTPVGTSSFCIPAGTDNYSLDLMSANPSVVSPYDLLLVNNPSENYTQTIPLANLGTAGNKNNQKYCWQHRLEFRDGQHHWDNYGGNTGNGDTDNVQTGNCDAGSLACVGVNVNAGDGNTGTAQTGNYDAGSLAYVDCSTSGECWCECQRKRQCQSLAERLTTGECQRQCQFAKPSEATLVLRSFKMKDLPKLEGLFLCLTKPPKQWQKSIR